MAFGLVPYVVQGADKLSIDCFYHSPDLKSAFSKAMFKMRHDALWISDHFGSAVSLQ
jgi:hypothetical protein